jgi:hypothetical protein
MIRLLRALRTTGSIDLDLYFAVVMNQLLATVVDNQLATVVMEQLATVVNNQLDRNAITNQLTKKYRSKKTQQVLHFLFVIDRRMPLFPAQRHLWAGCSNGMLQSFAMLAA